MKFDEKGYYLRSPHKGWTYVDEWEGENLIIKYLSKRKRGEVQLFNWYAQYNCGKVGRKPHFLSIELNQFFSAKNVPRIPEILLRYPLLFKNLKTYNLNRSDGYPRSSYASGALKVFLETFFKEWKWKNSGLSKKVQEKAHDAIKYQLKMKFPNKKFSRIPQLYLTNFNPNKFTYTMIKAFHKHFSSLHPASRPYKMTSQLEYEYYWRYCEFSKINPFLLDLKPRFQLTRSLISFRDLIENVSKINSLTEAYYFLLKARRKSIAPLKERIVSYDEVENLGFNIQTKDKKHFYNERHPDGVIAYVQAALMDKDIINNLNKEFPGLNLPIKAIFDFTSQSRIKRKFLVSKITPIFEDVSATFDKERKPLDISVFVLIKKSTEHLSSKNIIDYLKFIHDPLEEKRRILLITIIPPKYINPQNINPTVSREIKNSKDTGIIDIGIYLPLQGIKNFGMIFGALSWVRTSIRIHSKPDSSDGVLRKTMEILQDSGINDISFNEIEKLNSLFDEFSINNPREAAYDTFLNFLKELIKVYGHELS